MDETEKLLKELTEASGIPGYETEIRSIIHRYFQPLGQITHDKLGSLVCQKTGDATEPKVMLAAHMDEIGLMVSHITENGFVKFIPVGGWWDHVLLAQRMAIKTNKGDVIGVIGAKPPHVLTDEERKKLVEKKDMYLDIGATSQKEAEETGVRVGDPIIPVSQFTIMANGRSYLSKALDDRVGCAVTIATMQKLAKTGHPNTVFGVATVQEEVGLRGATTSVDMVNPDVAIILEDGITGDVPGIKYEDMPTKLGSGPILTLFDESMIPNLKLRDFIIDTARKHQIPLQTHAGGWKGSTDGAVIHKHRSGVPTVLLGIPVRHCHSHAGIMHRSDFDQTVELLTSVIRELDKNTAVQLTSW